MKIYVAVVTKAWELSGRPDGDWACFLDKNQKMAIAKAANARAKWEAKGYGPYKIWVGILNYAVNIPVKYELEPITEEKKAVSIPVSAPDPYELYNRYHKRYLNHLDYAQD